MPEILFEPIPIAYRGLLADSHLVDAQQFGKSLIGASKLANSICHHYFLGNVTHDPRSYQIRFCVLPSRQNGLLQEIVAVLNSGHMNVFTPILLKIGRALVERTIDAVIKKSLNNPSETSQAIAALREVALQNGDIAKQMHLSEMKNQEWLRHMVEKLSSENRAAIRELPEPVGRTVREVRIGDRKSPTIIDEPAAEVLRSSRSLEVADAQEYRVRLKGVFKTNGSCRIELEDGSVVAGKITDPAVTQDKNIYTRALNDNVPLQVTAKATVEGGKLKTLFVSDGKLARQTASRKKRL